MKTPKPDMADLIIKMQQQLVSLEKKIDDLANRPPKPFQRFDRSHGHGEPRRDRDRMERTLYKAICADCKKECEVPFRPSQDRPVYCKECFSSRKASGPFKAPQDNMPGEKDPARERPFGKYHGGANRRPAGKRKPATKRRKR